jgi:hypothetical protein
MPIIETYRKLIEKRYFCAMTFTSEQKNIHTRLNRFILFNSNDEKLENYLVMNKEKDILEYDEDDSVKFIQNHLPESMKNEFSDDEINYIVDLIYEFYEEKGFLEEDEDREVEIDEDELFKYVAKNARKEGVKSYTDDQIEAVIAGELAYCDSLNIFD